VDVLAGHAGEHAVHVNAGHQLGFLHGGAHGPVVPSMSVTTSRRIRRSAPARHKHLHDREAARIRGNVRDDGTGLGGADVEAGNQIGTHQRNSFG